VRHVRGGRKPYYEDICAENNLNLFDYHAGGAEAGFLSGTAGSSYFVSNE